MYQINNKTMIKKIALLILCILPMGAMAQTLKFGHVNTIEVIQIMPEYEKAIADLKDLEKKYTDEIRRAEDEFNRKYTEYIQQQDSLPKNIAERRQKELQDLMERGQQFQQEVQENLQKAQQEMTAPIFTKVENALKAVGEEGGYIYIFDLGRTSIPYVSSQLSTDVTAALKAKLGIK